MKTCTWEECEARIARWEALEADAECIRQNPIRLQPFAPPPAAQALQPTINAELAKAIATTPGAVSYSGCCMCNSPAVPTSMEDWPLRGDRWCRKCAHEYCQAVAEGKMYSDYVYDNKYAEPAPAECGCGGPAGHVPNGLLCRKGLR